MIEHVVEKIKAADLVLVGIGEELETLKWVREKKEYQKIAENIGKSWILPFVEKREIEEAIKDRSEIYKLLSGCLEGKNYFIVSLCQDGMIREAGLEEGRIVEPCGGYKKLQCSDRCSAELYDVPEGLMQQIRAFMDGTSGEDELKEPVCPLCGKPLVFNNVSAENYVEEGYLDQWMLYKKWLQGTVNKNVCILEIGVGMKYPTVIRWPFEKVTFYNQKAELFRVHSRLYQITEEIKERGWGICQKPEEFLKELSKGI